MFKLENIYYSYDKTHNCLRLIDYEIAVFDNQAIQDLNIIQYVTSTVTGSPQEQDIGADGANQQENSPLIPKWNHLRPYLKGIGRRTWFLHQLRKADGKFDSKRLIGKGLLNQKHIFERKVQNVLVCFFEGMVDEQQEQPQSGKIMKMQFGRSLYCNFEKSYHIGYMAGNERHAKGILVRRNQIFQQGFFTKNKIEPGSNFEVVDLM